MVSNVAVPAVAATKSPQANSTSKPSETTASTAQPSGITTKPVSTVSEPSKNTTPTDGIKKTEVAAEKGTPVTNKTTAANTTGTGSKVNAPAVKSEAEKKKANKTCGCCVIS